MLVTIGICICMNILEKKYVYIGDLGLVALNQNLLRRGDLLKM